MSSLQLAHLVRWKELKESCAREQCHASSLRRSLLGRNTGIRFGGAWYCSAECFREGAEARLRELQEEAVRWPKQPSGRIPLGLLLVARGCITGEQLRIAAEHQRVRGGALGDILCQLEFASEREVADATATQWGCPVYYARPQAYDIQARIPAELMRLVAMAPVYYAAQANRLLVGFVHRIEHRVLRTIEEMTSCCTEPCFITTSECEQTIRSLSGRSTEVGFERISSAGEMASIVQSYACQIGADEARMGVCRDYAWVRLNRDHHPTDLLFALTGKEAGWLEFDDAFRPC